MPRYFEVERVTTSSRRFIVDVGSYGTQEDAERIVKSNLAHELKNRPDVEQIFYLTNNTVQTIGSSDNPNELNPHSNFEPAAAHVDDMDG